MVAKVFVGPMPAALRAISPKYRPSPRPVFDGEPSSADRIAARELFLLLDADSRDWYRRGFPKLFGDL